MPADVYFSQATPRSEANAQPSAPAMTFQAMLDEAITQIFGTTQRKKKGADKPKAGVPYAAEKMGISEIYLRSILSGDRPPPQDDIVFRISKVLMESRFTPEIWFLAAARDRSSGASQLLWNNILSEFQKITRERLADSEPLIQTYANPDAMMIPVYNQFDIRPADENGHITGKKAGKIPVTREEFEKQCFGVQLHCWFHPSFRKVLAPQPGDILIVQPFEKPDQPSERRLPNNPYNIFLVQIKGVSTLNVAMLLERDEYILAGKNADNTRFGADQVSPVGVGIQIRQSLPIRPRSHHDGYEE